MVVGSQCIVAFEWVSGKSAGCAYKPHVLSGHTYANEAYLRAVSSSSVRQFVVSYTVTVTLQLQSVGAVTVCSSYSPVTHFVVSYNRFCELM
jgi:hypothetical protein